ncbi:ralBP1-associated Eps domain-containing protein 1-like isoform X2 [Lethenteron reissneri]|uniref:ralBP1-associated Eps domain-containing protein 1-like isoform X2 n=1 Tax=Lethenteron reissneri TaxID=7753 RepID=UPI002AB7F2F9|nr:ralBP1-associated Eps domain-containing protein 1-like isoform X2 [Lethenteron reissneri]
MEGMSLSESEQSYYAELFGYCDVDNTKKVAAWSRVSELFRASQLPPDALLQITEMCGAKRLGYFGRSQFYIALKLIAVAQAGLPMRLESLSTVRDLPRFVVGKSEQSESSRHVTPSHHAPEQHEGGPVTPGGSSYSRVIPPPPARAHLKKLAPSQPQDPPGTGTPARMPSLDQQSVSKSPPQETPSPVVSPHHSPPASPVAWRSGQRHPSGDRGPAWAPYVAERQPGAEGASWPVGSTPPQQENWVSFTDSATTMPEGGAAVSATPTAPTHFVASQDHTATGSVSRASAAGGGGGGGGGGSGGGSSGGSGKELQRSASYSEDPWRITEEQRDYYINQFKTIQPDLGGLIPGSGAKEFFTKSKLPIVELSHIWELSDFDQDGALTLDEFCAAFHLVVARKNGYELPEKLPESLVPKLIDIDDATHVPNPIAEASFTSSPVEAATSKSPSLNQAWSDLHQNSEQWETFSDRSSSCQTLTQFDSNIAPADPETAIVHPVAIRMTPSKIHMQEMHINRATPEMGTPVSQPHPTPSRATEQPSATKFSVAKSVDGFHSSESSVSSDAEAYGAGFSRPRSFSGTSVDDSLKKQVAPPPPPPPRPNQSHSRSSSLDLNKVFQPPAQGQQTSGQQPAPPPAVPPRPHPQALQTSRSIDGADMVPGASGVPLLSPPISEQPNFADFTHFGALHAVPEVDRATGDTPDPQAPAPVEKAPVKTESRVEEKTVTNNKIQQRSTSPAQPAPKKPSRRQLKSDEETVAAPPPPPPPPPPQEEPLRKPGGIAALGATQPSLQRSVGNEKKVIQASIRKNKETNTVLARLNSELQQQLKDLLEERIALEAQLEQLRPFSHT